MYPIPFAAEDHQTSNAMALVKKNAALLIKDEHVVHDLEDTLLGLATNQEQQVDMSKELKKLGIKNADERIAQLVIDLGK